MRLAWTSAGILAVIATVAVSAVLYLRQAPLDRLAYRSTILATVTPDPNAAGILALSPDGSRLAFIGSDTVGHSVVYVRALDGDTLMFSILANNWSVPARSVERAADSIAVRLASFRRR